MADQPSKTDIQAIFKRLRSIPTNKQCFDCQSNNPTWASVTYGVFLCIDCSAVHRSLGVHITFIRSTQLDTSWTWIQLRAMQVGGNANATHFFRQHGCTSSDSQQKYHSRAAELYKGKLHSLATQAMKLHGTKVHIESHHDSTSPVHKEVDFFDAHTEDKEPDLIQDNQKLTFTSEPKPIKNGSLSKAEEIDPSEGPSVDHALSMSPTQAMAVAEPRKALIGAKKTGGAKKSKGFGAQRVKANFSEIENKAQQLDKEREELAKNMAVEEAKTQEQKDKQMATMKLAYKDMSIERKKQEDKLMINDPKKAAQFERLGMGFSGHKGVSHSAMTDMQTINQDSPDKDSKSRLDKYSSKPTRSRNFFEDELDDMGFSGNKNESAFDIDRDNSWGSKESSWGSSNKSGSWDIDRFESKQSFTENFPSKNEDDRPSRSRKAYDYNTTSSAEDAQKKFGNAKAISSDQYFGGRDSDFETKQNLQKFQGSNSISSDDYFGDNSSKNRSYNSGPDLQEIKDGVRQGVTKVAGKISSIASGVMTSLQDKYGN
ncbi:ADP-ribosylation factor GTPase-activating protein 2-like isoform X1 [Mytilus trossulus]|uniref:ADP-ribosylation factor GTPase-activating protein 2-like isoform X1 n=1 Tax=Mytilus trossulus TaxID=6551 RepID=UPI003007A0B9